MEVNHQLKGTRTLNIIHFY